MKDQLKRILNLVRKTGDTMIVTDSDGDNAYVVMDLDQYEMLIDSGMQEFPDFDDEDDEEGIDLEEIWPELPVSEPELPVLERENDIWDTMQPAGSKGETWDVSNMSDQEMVDLEQQYAQFMNKAVAETVESTPAPPIEEPTPKIEPKNEEFGEEQFYLEPIE